MVGVRKKIEVLCGGQSKEDCTELAETAAAWPERFVGKGA